MIATAPALLQWPIGDPGRYLDYVLDYSCWLRSGETIATSTWSVPSPLSFVNPSILPGGQRVGVWLQGGTSGTVAQVKNTITTSQGRIDVRTVNLPIGPH
jgi:hypothetical protein